MGMFDYVDYTMDCPQCGKSVSDFQSKDGPCLMSTLTPLMVTHFYTSCDHCGAWIELSRNGFDTLPQEYGTMDEFKVSARKHD